MSEKTVEKVAGFRLVLLNNNINYKECGFGHFQIFSPKDGVMLAQVWPSTEKMITPVGPNVDCKTVIGLENITELILSWYLRADASKCDVRKDFEAYADRVLGARMLITVTELVSGALEVQTNTSDIVGKYDYILSSYDEQMRLKNNTEIQILDFLIV